MIIPLCILIDKSTAGILLGIQQLLPKILKMFRNILDLLCAKYYLLNNFIFQSYPLG